MPRDASLSDSQLQVFPAWIQIRFDRILSSQNDMDLHIILWWYEENIIEDNNKEKKPQTKILKKNFTILTKLTNIRYFAVHSRALSI